MSEIKLYDSSQKKAWDEFVSLAKNKHFMFFRDYIEYHSNRFEDYSMMIFDDKNKLIALLPANISKNSVYSHQGLTFGGLILKTSAKQQDVNDIFDSLISFLKENGVEYFLYKKMPYIYHISPSDEDLYPLFKHGFRISRRDISSTIKTSHRIKYSERRRRCIKRSLTVSLVYRESENIAEFWDNLSDVLMCGHSAKPVHTYDEIVFLKKMFPNNIKFFSANLKGEQVAGVVVFITDSVAHMQYIYTNDKGRDVCALDGLMDYLINDVFSIKDFFDFGTSMENQGEYINEGLISQKEGFGGRAITHDFYEVNIND
ncbi:GNAT family N-acetyltransferase [Edwardsiella tarda]|uniref:GNAT family N-acetyltransferase n=1 Tax=Edwardsiella tarda TaxID=636 RepID=UPI00351C578D